MRRRLRRLVQDEVVRVVAVPDPEKMGFNTVSLIGVQADPDKQDDVATRLAELPETQYVALTTGSFDIFIWVALASAEELGVFLRNKVGATHGVRRTETFVNLSIKKRWYGPALKS